MPPEGGPRHVRAAAPADDNRALVVWLLLRPRPAKPSTLGWFSVSVSVLCLLATVFVWGAVAADDTLTGSTGVAYAEYFYFILYLVIALAAFNVVECTSTRRFRLIDWNGNMAARLLHWPVVTVLLLTTTVAVLLL
ncbi:hypothetical protein ACIOGZ_32390 [Kitasatospora sp. NPDC088160]|uniref:hypothetical protein n=1 Tax=Kitasatospora sp. NPDC088160 TaxID=3364072 RepID=UPI00381EBDDB